MTIRVEFEGGFRDRAEAASALEEAASRVRRGEYSASALACANPMVFVTEDDDDDLPSADDVRGIMGRDKF